MNATTPLGWESSINHINIILPKTKNSPSTSVIDPLIVGF